MTAALIACYVAQMKPGRYHSLAITSLEQAVMWIMKELTA